MRDSELKRLDFENTLFILFIFLCLINIDANNKTKEYVKTNDINFKNEADNMFILTITVSIFIYLYYFNRNYNAYKNASKRNKKLLEVKVYGSLLLVIGAVLLLYFQKNQTSFIDSPAL